MKDQTAATLVAARFKKDYVNRWKTQWLNVSPKTGGAESSTVGDAIVWVFPDTSAIVTSSGQAGTQVWVR